jgi:UDP-2,4-diacetamido-2,4,6-trideoxy-beta-L-altropyranose hydrolase
MIIQRGYSLKDLPSAAGGLKSGTRDLAHSDWLGMTQEADANACLEVLRGQTFDWLIVDHYALDRRFQAVLRAVARHVMVIDDLADRCHECDILLDQNLGRSTKDYDGLISPWCTKLIGPQNALLRPMFLAHRMESLARREEAKLDHIVVSIGGFDVENVSAAVVDALDRCDLPEHCRISVVMGQDAPWINHVRSRAKAIRRPTSVLVGVEDMARLLTSCDLAIGSAGGSAWERCCLGVPTILLVAAANQLSGSLALEEAGAAIIADSPDSLPAIFQLNFGRKLREISTTSSKLCDGEGAERVSMAMSNEYLKRLRLREANHGDRDILLEWANEKAVRENSFNKGIIETRDHRKWFEKSLADSGCKIFILEDDDGARIGQVRFNLAEDKFWYIGYSIAAEWRGQGLGKFMLERAILRHRASRFHVDVRAWVKRENHSSAGIFLKLSFHLANTNESGDCLYELKNGGQSKNIVLIASPHHRSNEIAADLQKRFPDLDVRRLSSKDELHFGTLQTLRPEWIFFTHWSWMVPSDVFSNFRCVIFRMADLPYGRGGSPLQNLIARGHSTTKISAIRCEEGVDTGYIYLKEDLELSGTAEEICRRAGKTKSKMIAEILEAPAKPVVQIGDATIFKRRRPEDGDLSKLDSLNAVYDFIRMLDADGYPKSFIEFEEFKLEFTDAKLVDGHVEAKVTFRKRIDGE